MIVLRVINVGCFDVVLVNELEKFISTSNFKHILDDAIICLL